MKRTLKKCQKWVFFSKCVATPHPFLLATDVCVCFELDPQCYWIFTNGVWNWGQHSSCLIPKVRNNNDCSRRNILCCKVNWMSIIFWCAKCHLNIKNSVLHITMLLTLSISRSLFMYFYGIFPFRFRKINVCHGDDSQWNHLNSWGLIFVIFFLGCAWFSISVKWNNSKFDDDVNLWRNAIQEYQEKNPTWWWLWFQKIWEMIWVMGFLLLLFLKVIFECWCNAFKKYKTLTIHQILLNF